MRKFITVALTGGIACGKNTAADKFKELGCIIIDTDEIVHNLYKNDKIMLREITAVFGSGILDENMQINRKSLAKTAFLNEENIERLNSIVHPKVKDELNKIFKRLDDEGYCGCAVVMVPQLIEAGMAKDFDKVILLCADEQKRIERCVKNRALTEDEVKRRMNYQLDDEYKRKYADYVIDNNGSIESALKQAEDIYNNLNKTTF